MIAASMKTKIQKRNKTKQIKNNVTPEKYKKASTNQKTPGEYNFAPLMTNKLWRANQTRLLWAILSWVLPGTSGHTTAFRNPALILSAAIYFAIKRSAPCSAILRHSSSSWAAVVHWSALIPEALKSLRKHLIHPFPYTPRSPRPHQFSEHHGLRQSLVHARHKFLE